MTRQEEILNWCVDTFGPVAQVRVERAARLVEEAIELGQVEGVTADMLHRLVDRVYSRPAGKLFKEVGQVGMTLDALAENVGIDVNDAVVAEMLRVRLIPKEDFARRHNAKVDLGIANPIV